MHPNGLFHPKKGQSSRSEGDGDVAQAGWLWSKRIDSATPDQLSSSLTALRQDFDDFAQQAEASGAPQQLA